MNGIFAVLCLLGGGALLIVEALIPGFGLPGISGIVLTLMGVYFLHFLFEAGMVAVLLLAWLVLVGVIIFLLLRSAVGGRLASSRLFLREKDQPSTMPQDLPAVGMRGRAISALRPAGIADFDGKRVNVVTEGEYIASGETLLVMAVQGNRVVVQGV